jgi:predicted GIY-YIG superfamily endonuclease
MRLIIPGVYLIRCVPTGDAYVGGAQNMRNRWASHRGALRAGRHPNKRLQALYTEYGADALSYSVLEVSYALHQLKDLERAWIRRIGSTLNSTRQRPGGYPVNWHYGQPFGGEARRLIDQYAKCGGDSEAYARYLRAPNQYPLPPRLYRRKA